MTTREAVRRIALALPQAYEDDHFGAASYRVRKKIFAVLREADRVTLKLDPEDQRNLAEAHPGIVESVAADGARLAKAGLQGWTYLRYEACDDELVASLLKLAWSGVAPKRLMGI